MESQRRATPIWAAAAQRAATAFDDFDRPNQILNGSATPSGHVWNVTGNGIADARIIDGALISPSNLNYYAMLNFGQQITRIAGAFSFVAVGSPILPNQSVATLIADTDGTLSNMLHLGISSQNWFLQKRIAAGAFVDIAGGRHGLRIGEGVYQIAMEISGSTVTVIPPNGQRVSVTDPDIGALNLQVGIFQGGPSGAQQYQVRWHGVVIGPEHSNALRALGQGQATAQATNFTRMKLRRGMREEVLPTADWYRILVADTIKTFSLMGRLTFEAQSASLFDAGVVDVSCIAPSQDVFISQIYAVQAPGSPVDQVRISADSGTNEIAVDVHTTTADVTLAFDFDGYGLLKYPVAGATALPTKSTVLTLTPNRTTGRPIIVGATADQSVTYLDNPTTGFSTTIPNESNALSIRGAVTLATGTVTMPAAPIDGQMVSISSTQTITAFTLNPNAGHTLDAAPSTLGAGPTGTLRYRYRASLLKWLPA